MTAPAHIDLTYAAVSLQRADLSVFFQIIEGFHALPTVRGRDRVIPGLAGRSAYNRKNDVLRILLEGHITYDPALSGASAYEDFWANMRAMRQLFASDRARAEMVATLVDGSIWVISARPMNLLRLAHIPNEYVEWNVEFEGYGDWEVGS